MRAAGDTQEKKEPPRARGPQGHTRALDPVSRVKLMRRIAFERAKTKPPTWKQLSAREGVPERTLQALHKQYEADQDTLSKPVAVVDETIDLYGELITELGEMAQEAGGNLSARVGAVSRMADIAKARLELMAAVGRLPRRMRDYEAHRDVERMIFEMSEVVEKHDLPSEVIEDLLAVIERSRAAAEPGAAQKPAAVRG